MKKLSFLFVVLLITTCSALAQEKENPLPYWVDSIVTQPEGYYTDAEGNVEISSSDGLVWLISVLNGLNCCEPDNFEGRTVKLVNDIDFGNEGWNFCFSPIGTRSTPFLGTFDGDGHKIHHLRQRYSRFDTINNYYFDMGVFGYIRHASVKNVTLDSTCIISSNCEYPGYSRVGMVGYADSLSTVDNVYIHSHGISFSYGSSLVGMNRNSTIRNCAYGFRDFESAPIKEGAGLVSYNRSEGGYADAVVENCYFYGRIAVVYTPQYYLAGLVCFNETIPNQNGKQAIVRNCHSTPTADFIAGHHGSLVAVQSEGSSIKYCYTDPTKMYQYAQMVGLNEGGELYYCSEYINMDGIGTLALPVNINDSTTDNLLDALNLWIANQEHPELYRTWTIINDSIPVFGDYYVGIPENEASFDAVTIHPNPTNGFVRIEGITATEVQVYNAMGQRLKTVQNTNEIDMGYLPKGVYLLRIKATDGYEHTGRVAVSK